MNMEKNKEKPNHTPTPWEIVALAKSKNSRFPKNGELGDFLIRQMKEAPGGIAITIGGLGKTEEANAEFIVRAVNSHEALLETLKKLRLCVHKPGCYCAGYDDCECLPDIIDDAIAQAEGA